MTGSQNTFTSRLASAAALGALLVLAVFTLYWTATGFEFSRFDDLTYYVQNDHVKAGLDWNGVVWAYLTVLSVESLA